MLPFLLSGNVNAWKKNHSRAFGDTVMLTFGIRCACVLHLSLGNYAGDGIVRTDGYKKWKHPLSLICEDTFEK